MRSSYYPEDLGNMHHHGMNNPFQQGTLNHPYFQEQQGIQGGPFFEGWPGVSLKQIMGQLDIFNGNFGNTDKWNNSKDKVVNEHAGSEFCMSSEDFNPQPAITGETQLQSDYINGSSGSEICQMNRGSAFLGPQIWNQKLGMDFVSEKLAQENECPSSSESSLEWIFKENEKQDDMEFKAEDFSAADIALASAPGKGSFDPRTRCFSSAELRPLPVIRKRMKIYVSDSEKNEEYWAKRVKNNVAARRSREAKRVKENQIALRTAFLEQENSSLRVHISTLRHCNQEIQKDVEGLLKDIKDLTSMQKEFCQEEKNI